MVADNSEMVVFDSWFAGNQHPSDCLHCFAQHSTWWLRSVQFVNNTGIMASNKNSYLNVSDMNVSGITGAVVSATVASAHRLWLEQVFVERSTAWNHTGLFAWYGKPRYLKNPDVLIRALKLNQNEGRLAYSEATETPSGVSSDWDCPRVASTAMRWSNVEVSGNRVGSQSKYLMELKYHRIRFRDVVWVENECTEAGGSIVSGAFDSGGCVWLTDSALSMEENSFEDNKGSFMVAVSRREESLGVLNALSYCFEEVQARGDVGNAWLYVPDMSSDDHIYVNASVFNSSSLSYAAWVTNSMGSGRTVKVSWTHTSVYTVSESALHWVSGSKLNVGLEMNVSQSVFTTTAFSGDWMAQNDTNVLSTVVFEENTFRDYTDQHASDLVIDVRSSGAPVLVILKSNSWSNLDVQTWIESRGPVDMVHSDMTLKGDTRYLYAYDVLSLNMWNVHFEEFSDALWIERSSYVESTHVPSMQVSIDECSFNNSDVYVVTQSSRMIIMDNVQPFDNVHIDSCYFRQAFVNMSLGSNGDDLMDGSLPHVMVNDSTFEGLTNESALYIADLSTAQVTSGKRCVVELNHVQWRGIKGGASVMEVKLIANNVGSQSGNSDYRLSLMDNVFENNEVLRVIDFVSNDEMDSSKWNGAPAVHMKQCTFIKNQASALVYQSTQGSGDLSNYLSYVGMRETLFDSNMIANDGACVDVKSGQMWMHSAIANDHWRVVSVNLGHVRMHQVNTSNSTALYVSDSREHGNSVYGADVKMIDCYLAQHDNALEAYLHSEDSLVLNDTELVMAQMNVYSGTVPSAAQVRSEAGKVAEEVLLTECRIHDYRNRHALVLDSNGQGWMPNVTLTQSTVSHNHNNNDSSAALFLIMPPSIAGNSTYMKSVVYMSDNAFALNGDVVRVDDSTYALQGPMLNEGQNAQTVTADMRPNEVRIENNNATDNFGSVVHHHYVTIPSTNVLILASNWSQNVQGSMQSSTSLIFVNASQCVEPSVNATNTSSSYADIVTSSHLTIDGNVFADNRFEDGLVRLFCARAYVTKSTFDGNKVCFSLLSLYSECVVRSVAVCFRFRSRFCQMLCPWTAA